MLLYYMIILYYIIFHYIILYYIILCYRRQRLPLRSADRRQRLPSPGQGDDRVAPLRLGQGDDRVTSARALQQIMYL